MKLVPQFVTPEFFGHGQWKSLISPKSISELFQGTDVGDSRMEESHIGKGTLRSKIAVRNFSMLEYLMLEYLFHAVNNSSNIKFADVLDDIPCANAS